MKGRDLTVTLSDEEFRQVENALDQLHSALGTIGDTAHRDAVRSVVASAANKLRKARKEQWS